MPSTEPLPSIDLQPDQPLLSKALLTEEVADNPPARTDSKPAPAFKECPFCFSEIPAKALRCKVCMVDLAKTEGEEKTGFVLTKTELRDPMTGLLTVSHTVKIVDDMLTGQLRNYLVDDHRLMERTPILPLEDLFTFIPVLRRDYPYFSKGEVMREFCDWLEKEFEEATAKYEAMRDQSIMTFDGISFLFPRGTKVCTVQHGELVGFEVSESSYLNGPLCKFAMVKGDVVKSDGSKFFLSKVNVLIPQFSGTMPLKDLPVKILTPDIEEQLVTRGRKFVSLALGAQYLSYVGNIHIVGQNRLLFRCDGRVMFDTSSYNIRNPGQDAFLPQNAIFDRHSVESTKEYMNSVPDSRLYQCHAFVGGFSFVLKKWGELAVSCASSINFDSKAFSHLVLPPANKELIEALITHKEDSLQDVITGKGGGCIFLLHGPPGVGKTLTAEAVAELLQRPLYSVTVGELGTSTSSLEEKLRGILDVANIWDAVILIDEADVFLEKRSDRDIQRNAMTGIFLRLLEYHQGVLFLTTNRVSDFDEAFFSRISVGLKYHDLDEDARSQVWANFFELGGITNLDPRQFSVHPFNGRQIRNAVRLAIAIARKEKKAITAQHIERTIAVTKQFQRDLLTDSSTL